MHVTHKGALEGMVEKLSAMRQEHGNLARDHGEAVQAYQMGLDAAINAQRAKHETEMGQLHAAHQAQLNEERAQHQATQHRLQQLQAAHQAVLDGRNQQLTSDHHHQNLQMQMPVPGPEQ